MTVYVAAFVVQWLVWGLPVDTLLIFFWLLAGVVCWNIGKPAHHHLKWARDWGPILGLLLVYDFSRGFAENGRAPHITELIDADRWMFGGELPTLWLQDKLYDPHHVHWWDVLASFIYMSHFVLCLGIATVLWVRRRELWAAFMRRWFVLTALGLATYFAYPAAPPWWAAKHGYLDEHVARLSGRGWSAIGLESTGRLLNQGQAMSNPVAAMPSLHSAFALLAVAFFLTRVSKKWWPLLLAYPVAMVATLVYSGEHYVIDALVGWAYVGIAFVAAGAAERWWRRRRAARTASPGEAEPTEPTEPQAEAAEPVGHAEPTVEPVAATRTGNTVGEVDLAQDERPREQVAEPAGSAVP